MQHPQHLHMFTSGFFGGAAWLCLLFLGLFADSAKGICVGPQHGEGCAILRLTARSNSGRPAQVEKTSDTAYTVTLCEDDTSFRVFADATEPVFASGKTCTLSGVPRDDTAIESGATETYTLSATEALQNGSNATTVDTVVTVKRLGAGVDQSACAVTRQRSAIEDCGFAPYLEKRRLAAAKAGLPLPPSQAPSALQRSRVSFGRRLRH
eukprot:TRINITY_DN45468_c0_g1_i1.p1 TRINITY_DN45468_c0_g1~~TRINITY_DN45468_c0_g1_i1.p1  ORF type:complete len:227 (+),score=26.30 TRINITY_DN45468_c0_g1_i1:57-683(+)